MLRNWYDRWLWLKDWRKRRRERKLWPMPTRPVTEAEQLPEFIEDEGATRWT